MEGHEGMHPKVRYSWPFFVEFIYLVVFMKRFHPLFVLGGLIYEVTDNFDIDFGIKTGLNKAEADYTLLAGVTFRF